MVDKVFQNPFGQGVDAVEHSQPSGAKKVVIGPLSIPSWATDDTRNVAPIEAAIAGAAAVTLALLAGRAYRVISNIAVRFRQGNAGVTADATDVYLPANTPIVISTSKWTGISAIRVVGTDTGFFQAVEVQ